MSDLRNYETDERIDYEDGACSPQPAASVDAEPVAWMYTLPMQYQPKLECTKNLAPVIRLSLTRWENVRKPWTETPLCPASALEAARREALEEAAKAAYVACAETRHVSLGDKCAAAIRALKENPNAE